MEHDPDYQAWVAANCESSCPDGERKDEFSDRICKTFAALVDKALADGEDMLVILAHGGTQMAARWSVTPCPNEATTSGAAPTRAAMCWMHAIGPRSTYCTWSRPCSTPRRVYADILGGAGRFCAGCHFCGPGLAASPGGADGPVHLGTGKRLRAALPTTPQGELLGGGIVAAVLPLGTLLVTGAACWLAAKLHPALGLALQMFWCGQALAAKGLKQEHERV